MKAAPSARSSIAGDPWPWALLLCALPLVVHALRTSLGEPFADDFYFLDRALRAGTNSLWDGGGSPLFWRPLSRQVYFGLFGRLMLAYPHAIVAVHLLVLLASGVLIHRALRPRWPGAWCAAVASFPLLLESNRMLITWPSHFQDLGALLFASLAVHQASRRRTWSMALALAGSLLCKEVAAVTALLLPWMPVEGAWSRGARIRASAWLAAVLAVWGAAYLVLIPRSGTTLGYHAEAAAPFVSRAAWALAHGVRSAFSLPSDGGSAELVVVVALALLLAAASVLAGADRAARGRLRGARPLMLWGALWWIGATLPLSGVYPLWSAQRAILASVGLGIALVGLLGSIHTLLLLPLLAIRLYAFALSPAGEGRISEQPPPGVEGDFPHVERLQRLTHETRALLAARVPHPPAGSRIGYHHFPPLSRHAFAGDAALRVWYAEPTLRWVSIDEFRAQPDSAVAGFVEYESGAAPQLAFVDTDALRAQVSAETPIGAGRWPEALAALARADSLQRDPAAAVFLATTEALRSVCLLMLGREAEAEQQARHALERWDGNQYSLYTLARLAIGRQRYTEADALLTRQLALYPEDSGSREMLARLRAAVGGGSGR